MRRAAARTSRRAGSNRDDLRRLPRRESTLRRLGVAVPAASPRAGLLDRLGATRYLVYGVVSEVCVRYAAFGLLETGARVEIITDAIKAIDDGKERETVERFQSQGGRLTTVDRALATALLP